MTNKLDQIAIDSDQYISFEVHDLFTKSNTKQETDGRTDGWMDRQTDDRPQTADRQKDKNLKKFSVL